MGIRAASGISLLNQFLFAGPSRRLRLLGGLQVIGVRREFELLDQLIDDQRMMSKRDVQLNAKTPRRQNEASGETWKGLNAWLRECNSITK